MFDGELEGVVIKSIKLILDFSRGTTIISIRSTNRR